MAAEPSIDPASWLDEHLAQASPDLLRANLDDFIPQGQPGSEQHDQARRHWLEHPALQATELRLSPTLATIVAVRMR